MSRSAARKSPGQEAATLIRCPRCATGTACEQWSELQITWRKARRLENAVEAGTTWYQLNFLTNLADGLAPTRIDSCVAPHFCRYFSRGPFMPTAVLPTA